ncbi:hypothetical protein [Haloferax sulfurifontis]|uniref:Uncharacterized protein n=1 Tax=Haloferax sulfurifontis TaxID=255616 RepID=A0A830DRI9_9EURY|nr:hypothetical protein [Haloferax sulfurifontis]GGC53090.1 hypothetical protein GCM10007209_13510 [Haloferax sulfurifontis]
MNTHFRFGGTRVYLQPVEDDETDVVDALRTLAEWLSDDVVSWWTYDVPPESQIQDPLTTDAKKALVISWGESRE